MKNPYAIGELVYLRPLEPEDAQVVAHWFNDPDVSRTLRMWRPMTVVGEAEFLTKLGKSEGDVILGVTTVEGDRLIGSVGLHGFEIKNRSGCFGVLIGEKREWGKGYGGEATRLMVDVGFGTINLHRIWLEVFAENERGIRAYEKAGFRREGLMRRSEYREGCWHDSVLMAILRDEWEIRPHKPAKRATAGRRSA